MYDYIMKIQHGTQIVYPKDLGYIVARAGITSGQKILEIGTGSGICKACYAKNVLIKKNKGLKERKIIVHYAE